jgi:proteasome lid subunit RPN8/RPN11
MRPQDTQGLTNQPTRRLSLSQTQWEFMHAHVAECLPYEACGLLAGKIDTVHEVLAITNQLRSPTRFRMEPAEQVRAFAAMESRGLELLGIYHSHPSRRATASGTRAGLSPTDIAEAAYPVTQVLWSRTRGSWGARGYWIEAGRVSEVDLAVTSGT